MFTGDPAVRSSTADMLAAETAPDQDAADAAGGLIEAFYFVFPAERLALGMTLPDLGNRLRRGAGTERRCSRPGSCEGSAPSSCCRIGRRFRHAGGGPRRSGPRRHRELLSYGPVSVVLTSALWDARRDARSLRTDRRGRSRGGLTAGCWTSRCGAMSMAELKGGTPRRAEEHLDRVRELRRGHRLRRRARHQSSPCSRGRGHHLMGSGVAADHARMVGLGALHAAGTTALAAREIADGAYEDAYFRLKPLVDDPSCTSPRWSTRTSSRPPCERAHGRCRSAGRAPRRRRRCQRLEVDTRGGCAFTSAGR